MIDGEVFHETHFAGSERVAIRYDEKRATWNFLGLGFDFYAYPCVGDCFEAEVTREGEDTGPILVRVECGSSGKITADVFASKVLKELSRYWEIECSPYFGARIAALLARGELPGVSNV